MAFKYRQSVPLEEAVWEMWQYYNRSSRSFGGVTTYVDSAVFSAEDAYGFVISNKATALTLSVPADATADIPIGATIDGINIGAGDLTIAADTGATLRIPTGSTGVIAVQYKQYSLTKIAANTWALASDGLGV